ncbi:MAG: curli production assembly protein CsgG [Acidobacteria bacterium]|nr:MAG: curli production assembly protein CsgG [Acidobacteriota bacterium]
MSRNLKQVCALVLLLGAFAMADQKKRVAVLNFDYGTVQNSVAAIFGTNQDVGKGISDLLVQKLVQDGKFSVIERNALEKVLAEQNFSNSDRADAATAAKIGRILGVDAIIMGTVTQFGRDDKSTTVGGGGASTFTSKFGLGGLKKSVAKAVVAVTARLVDTSTGEILSAVTGNGESTRSGTSLLSAGGSGSGASAGAYDMSNANFANTILGEAVQSAVNSLAEHLDANATTLPTHKVKLSGLVADVNGNTVILNIGTKAGVKVGDAFEVQRPTRTIKDPATGKVIKTIADKVGTLTVTDADEQSATATFNGTGAAKVGDVVKTPN